MHSIKKDFVKDLICYLPANLIPAIFGFIFVPAATRLFSPADYGNYTLVLTTVSIFSLIIGWLDMAVIRFYPTYEHKNESAKFCGLIVKLLLSSLLLISFFFLIIIYLFQNCLSFSTYNLMCIGLLLFILSSSFSTLLQILRAKRDIKYYTILSIWKSVVAVIFGFSLVLIFKLSVDGLLWGSLLSMVIVFPILWKKSIPKFSMETKTLSHLPFEMASYSFPLVFGNLAAWILSASDKYILSIFRDSTEVGIYSVSYSISESSILLIASLFILSSRPISLDIWEKEGSEKAQKFLHNVTRYYLIICIPATVGLTVLAKPIIFSLTSPMYYEGYKIVSFIAFASLFFGMQQIFQSGLIFYKKTMPLMVCIFASALVNLILNFIFVPRYGYIAAGATTFIGYLCLMVLVIITSRKLFRWQFPLKSLFNVLFASSLMAIVIYFLSNFSNPTLINLLIIILFGSIFYISLLFLLKEWLPDELKYLNLFFRIDHSNLLQKKKREL